MIEVELLCCLRVYERSPENSSGPKYTSVFAHMLVKYTLENS